MKFGLEFHENHSYYFIVPSEGMKSMDYTQTAGGVCESHGLKFIFNVKPGKFGLW